MKKDWWLVIILAVCLVLFVAVLFLGEGVKTKVQSRGDDFVERGEDFRANPDEDNAVGGSGSGSSSSSDFGLSDGNGVVVNGSEVEEEFVPDILGSECGFYFEGYGICAGTCSEGECVSEGRSCYCK